MYPLHNMD